MPGQTLNFWCKDKASDRRIGWIGSRVVSELPSPPFKVGAQRSESLFPFLCVLPSLHRIVNPLTTTYSGGRRQGRLDYLIPLPCLFEMCDRDAYRKARKGKRKKEEKKKKKEYLLIFSPPRKRIDKVDWVRLKYETVLFHMDICLPCFFLSSRKTINFLKLRVA